jgi:hypothetical protein
MTREENEAASVQSQRQFCTCLRCSSNYLAMHGTVASRCALHGSCYASTAPDLPLLRCCICPARYNLKRRLDKKQPLSEQEFEALIEQGDDVSISLRLITATVWQQNR